MRDFKCLSANSRWTSWLPSTDTCTIPILGCHNSWNRCGVVFSESITMLTQIRNPFWNLSVVRGAMLKCVQKARRVAIKLIIAKKYLYNKQTLLHTPPKMNKFPDLAQPVFIGHSCKLDTNKTSHLLLQLFFCFIQIYSKLAEWHSLQIW